ncbi:MAG: tetratricopeptide repeat protein [Saprospiraceae bacterium]|nr:tetratricopeptide repeat protein [Saprospiraceae bacterium]
MKTIYILATLSLVWVIIGCQSEKNKTADTTKLPELLMRPQIIGPVNEMGYMLDQYNALANKLQTNPADHESKLALAELFMMEARISGEHGHYYPAALKLINEVLTQELKDPLAYRAMLDKASVLLSLHQFAEAKSIGEKALKLNPHSADIYGVLVDANVELGQYAEAVTYADKMVSIRPDLRSYSRVSYLREIHGMVDEAITAMKMAVAAGYPGMEQTEWARLTLGHLYERYGMLDSALVQYEMALATRPNYPFAIAAMSDCYAAMNKSEKADSLNIAAMALIPEVSFYITKANRELERGNTVKADEMTKEILVMLADDEEAGHQMNLEQSRVQLNLLKNPEKALQYAIAEYSVRPDNIDVNKLLAEIYYVQHDLNKSNEHLQKALITGTKDPETKCLEGILLAKSDKTDEGTKLIQAVFVEIPYLDCSYCGEARSIIL